MGQLLGTVRDWTLTVTPNLTDHSTFVAYMLSVERAGKRLLYTGDFRRQCPHTKVDRAAVRGRGAAQ